MQTAQRKRAPSVIRRLLDEPYRFEFAQAVRIIDALLGKALPDDRGAAARYIAYRNRTDLTFPASQVQDLAIEADAPVDSDDALQQAIAGGALRRICITPAFGGLLGSTGALPIHYTESLLAAEQRGVGKGPRAFFAFIGQRAQALHYRAWKQARVYYNTNTKGESILRLTQMAIAGVPPAARPWGNNEPCLLDPDIPAFYAAVLRHPSTSPRMLEDVLTEYFGMPFKVEEFIGEWSALEDHELTKLGAPDPGFGENYVLGSRIYLKTRLVRLRVGPLSIDDYERFLPYSDGARALSLLVSLFRVANLRFEVQLVLRAQDVRPVQLSAEKIRPARRLGYGSFTTGVTSDQEQEGVRYMLNDKRNEHGRGYRHSAAGGAEAIFADGR